MIRYFKLFLKIISLLLIFIFLLNILIYFLEKKILILELSHEKLIIYNENYKNLHYNIQHIINNNNNFKSIKISMPINLTRLSKDNHFTQNLYGTIPTTNQHVQFDN